MLGLNGSARECSRPEGTCGFMNAASRPVLRPFSAVALFVFLVVLLLMGALLSGCGGGGGGNSTTDEGFRFVPDGHGAVVPSANVHFEYDSGSVSSGVVVTAAPVAAGLPATPSGASGLGSAYQVTFSIPSLAFSPSARIYLPYDPALLPAGSVPRIYFAASASQPWQVLPVSTALPAPAAATILEAQLPAVLPSGFLLTIFAGTPSGLPTLNPFFGTFALRYAGTTTGTFSFSVSASGAVAGVPAGPVVTGTVTPAGIVNIVSGGQTYTGTLAVDPASGAVTASAAVWSGPGAAAGTWTLQ